jgi:hypothetical protein
MAICESASGLRSRASARLGRGGRRRALRQRRARSSSAQPVYRGEINHKDRSHPGEHEPIIERALFEAVQAKLDEQRRGKRRSHTSSEALLLGRIFDDAATA